MSTSDRIAWLLAVTVAVVTLLTAVALVWVTITRPGEDVTSIADAIGRILGVLVGALIGYMAGRRINGH